MPKIPIPSPERFIAWHACEVKDGSKSTIFSISEDEKPTGISCSIADEATVLAGKFIRLEISRAGE